MKIAICDDEIDFVETIYQYLWDEQNCTIDKFFNSEEVWDRYQNGYQYDIIFCDISIGISRKITASGSGIPIRPYSKSSSQ